MSSQADLTAAKRVRKTTSHLIRRTCASPESAAAGVTNGEGASFSAGVSNGEGASFSAGVSNAEGASFSAGYAGVARECTSFSAGHAGVARDWPFLC